MDNKTNLDFEINNSQDLNEMLTSLLMDIRRGEIDNQTGKVITLVAERINKNNANALVYKKLTSHKEKLPFFEGDD